MDTLRDVINKLKSISLETERNAPYTYGDNRKKVTKFCTDPDTMYRTMSKWYALATSTTFSKGTSLWMNSQRLDVKKRGSEQFAIVYIDYTSSSRLDDICIERRISKYIRS